VHHALEVRIAHADALHVRERVADVVDARTALADPLRDEAGAAVQVELAHEGRMGWVGQEGERAHGAAVAKPGGDEARLVDAAGHLAPP